MRSRSETVIPSDLPFLAAIWAEQELERLAEIDGGDLLGPRRLSSSGRGAPLEPASEADRQS